MTRRPLRWLTPAFPGRGTCRYDAEMDWIDGLEAALPAPVPVIEAAADFAASRSELARIRVEIQAATLTCHAAYFENLDALLENIGQLRRQRGVMWCRWGVLGSDDTAPGSQVPPYPLRVWERRAGTLSALNQWAAGDPPAGRRPAGAAAQRAQWIRMTLGSTTEEKRWLVSRLAETLRASLDGQGLARPAKGTVLPVPLLAAEPTRAGSMAGVQVIEQALARLEAQPCHFRFDRWTDNLIVAIGRMDYEGSHAPLEPTLTVKARTERSRQYVRSINAWIDEVPFASALALAVGPQDVACRVYAALDQPTPEKVWLAAALSKTIRAIGEEYRPRDERGPERGAGATGKRAPRS